MENKQIKYLGKEKKQLKKVLQLSMFLSLGIVLQIIESIIVIPIFIPGIKLGLVNIVTMTVVYTYGVKDGVKLGIIRVIVVGILRNGFGINFLFSLSGMLLSICAVGFAKKYSKLSVIGVSIVGANFHILGQIIAASFIYKTDLFFLSYLPFMFLITIVTGGIVGYVANEVMERMEIKSFL
ncbi:Gx transporter family protein [Leptotrichia sp. OH3620_COT-345]|uniref:Gx transporter family protein n=1 Tax=Leptotrichia sp. OH3620_COT-345 TaxID=2491048 RepID=UPI000F646ED4|nr:Gx transporter family protein [Leptotrichia sp. OH3620_COT-345]RRD41048.1 Gx transporter family protein [Leptotrichia sp. OH3620_COT-345]